MLLELYRLHVGLLLFLERLVIAGQKNEVQFLVVEFVQAHLPAPVLLLLLLCLFLLDLVLLGAVVGFAFRVLLLFVEDEFGRFGGEEFVELGKEVADECDGEAFAGPFLGVFAGE